MDDMKHTGQALTGDGAVTQSVLEGDLCITTTELAQAVKSYQVSYTAISVWSLLILAVMDLFSKIQKL